MTLFPRFLSITCVFIFAVFRGWGWGGGWVEAVSCTICCGILFFLFLSLALFSLFLTLSLSHLPSFPLTDLPPVFLFLLLALLFPSLSMPFLPLVFPFHLTCFQASRITQASSLARPSPSAPSCSSILPIIYLYFSYHLILLFFLHFNPPFSSLHSDHLTAFPLILFSS